MPSRSSQEHTIIAPTPIRLAWVSLALVLLATPALAQQRFALVIGANAGWANDRPLRYAESDAEHVRDVLVQLGGFPPDRAELLRDPTTAEVRASLRRLREILGKLDGETLVFVYYSGHADEQHLHLRGDPLSHAELYEQLRDLPATLRVGVVDACRSGSILEAKGGRPTASFDTTVVDELQVRGLALLTSSGADELSQERRALAGSVFTHHLVSGLRGAADADADGQVTLEEAYRYAYQRTEVDTTTTLVPQRPAFRYELKGAGDVVMTRPARSLSALVLPQAAGQRYVVVDEHEWRLIAEARSREEQPVPLALGPGRYLVQRVLPDHLEVAPLLLEPGGRVEVSSLSFTNRPLSAGFLKGHPDERDPSELREWRRNEALRLLAEGEAQSALKIFDALLVETPEDRASLRGRGRSLLRLAEAYERSGDRPREMRSLRAALVADPSLSADPGFLRWYQRLQEYERREAEEAESVRMEALAAEENPRRSYKWALGVEVGTVGLAITASYLLNPHWSVQLGLNPLNQGMGADLRVAPANAKLSPLLAVGAYMDTEAYGFVHADAGLQYFGASGTAVQIGIGLSYATKAPRSGGSLFLGVSFY